MKDVPFDFFDGLDRRDSSAASFSGVFVRFCLTPVKLVLLKPRLDPATRPPLINVRSMILSRNLAERPHPTIDHEFRSATQLQWRPRVFGK